MASTFQNEILQRDTNTCAFFLKSMRQSNFKRKEFQSKICLEYNLHCSENNKGIVVKKIGVYVCI